MRKRMMTYLKPSSDSISAPTTWPRWEWMSYLSEYINIHHLHTYCIFGETFFKKISERGKDRLQLFQVEFTWWWRANLCISQIHRLKMLIDEQARTRLIQTPLQWLFYLTGESGGDKPKQEVLLYSEGFLCSIRIGWVLLFMPHYYSLK